MSQMMSLHFRTLIFIFFLCFGSFLAGWLTAVFILPGNFSKMDRKTLETESQSSLSEENLSMKEPGWKNGVDEKQNFSFLEEMKNNILFLFDPYKMDSLVKKNTQLGNKEGPIKNQEPQPIVLKIPPPAENTLKPSASKSSFQNINKQKESLYPTLQELASLETRPKTNEGKKDSVLQTLQAEYDKKNREQLLQISGEQDFFTINGHFGFLVNVFSEQDKALEYVQNMKENYPLWSFLLKAYKDHVRIYLGPFQSKQKALEFKQSIPQQPPFALDFLEEVSL